MTNLLDRIIAEAGRIILGKERILRLSLACMLARVAGRSPLEYLDASERARQQEAVVGLMEDPPETINTLIQNLSVVHL